VRSSAASARFSGEYVVRAIPQVRIDLRDIWNLDIHPTSNAGSSQLSAARRDETEGAMPNASGGESGWWQAADGNWYPPDFRTGRPPRRRIRPWVLVAGGVVVLVGLLVLGSLGKHSSTETATTSTTTAPAGHLGEVVYDGNFSFDVRGVTCGITHIGPGTPTTLTTTEPASFGTTAPTGSQWCEARLIVQNIGTTSQTFFASNQYAIDTSGQRLSADTGAMFYTKTFGTTIKTLNPGVSIGVVIPFQLPSTDQISAFQLHDSSFSNGVEVENKR
jgi:hypothetical protein